MRALLVESADEIDSPTVYFRSAELQLIMQPARNRIGFQVETFKKYTRNSKAPKLELPGTLVKLVACGPSLAQG